MVTLVRALKPIRRIEIVLVWSVGGANWHFIYGEFKKSRRHPTLGKTYKVFWLPKTFRLKAKIGVKMTNTC